MGKSGKKQKEKKPAEEEANTPIDSVPNQISTASSSNSNLFNSLFGEIKEENPSVSLFSDSNPFRRKPNDSSQVPPNRQQTESRLENSGKTDTGLGTSDVSSELKKRKRKKDRNGNSEEEVTRSENETEERKKSRRVDDLIEGQEMNEKKQKKRKRDEVEAQYEAKKYGVAEQEEEKPERGGVVGRKRKEMESVEDTIIEKEGFDDESKLLRTVFVGNLPLKIKKKSLLKEFRQFGEIESLRIRSVPLADSKIPRKGAVIKKQINDAGDSVHAYVVFKTEESAQTSLAHNMSVLGGNHIRVDRACPPRKKLKGGDAPLYDNKRTVFVGNLPFDVKDEEVYQVFCSIKGLESSIEAIRVIRDPGTSLGKGIAYVLFKTRDAANLAARKHNLKLRDRELRLAHAKANATPSKRKAAMPSETNNSPAKKLARNLAFPGQENSMKSKAALSYQGLRASKSGTPKKTYSQNNQVSQNAPKPKVRLQKRPAVAARKAKQAGLKRKPENQTPDTNGRKKKARKFT